VATASEATSFFIIPSPNSESPICTAGTGMC
jgi:hypothetical protein